MRLPSDHSGWGVEVRLLNGPSFNKCLKTRGRRVILRQERVKSAVSVVKDQFEKTVPAHQHISCHGNRILFQIDCFDFLRRHQLSGSGLSDHES